MVSALELRLQRSPRLTRALLCLGVSCVFCLFLAMCVHAGETDDDWSIALYLSTRLPETSLSLHLNAILSKVIYALNANFPFVSWFFVLEYASACLAFATLLYGSLSYVRLPAGAVLVAFVSLYVLPYCIAQSNYTYVAGLASLTGGFMLVAQVGKEDVGPFARALPALFLALGLLWRVKMWLLCLPFTGIAYAWVLVSRHNRLTITGKQVDAETPPSRGWLASRNGVQRLLPAILAVLLCMGLIAFDALAWSNAPWASWLAYDQARTPISDYDMPEYDEIADELADLGISENDYYLLRHWANADTDTLNANVLNQINKLRTSPADSVNDILYGLSEYAALCMQKWKALALIVLAMLLVRYQKRQDYAVAFVGLLVVVAIDVYFVLIGRLLARVEDPLWACALALCVALSEPLTRSARRNGAASCTGGTAPSVTLSNSLGNILDVLGILIMLTAIVVTAARNVPYFNYPAFEQSWHQDTYEPGDSITDYLKLFPDTVFVMETNQYIRYELAYGFRYLPQEELASRVIPLGGWGSGSPFRQAQCEAVNASNPFEALLTSSQTVLVADEQTSERVLTFLQEHYDQSANCSRLIMFPSEDGDVYLWHYDTA